MKKILFQINKKTFRLAVFHGENKNFLRERFFYYLSASCLNLRDLL